MAQPSIKDGFITAGYEWLAALFTGGFKDDEMLVILEVAFQHHGLARLEWAELSQSDIARRAGKDPSNVGKAIRSLVRKGVLRKQGELYRFEPDYDLWELGKPEKRAAEWRRYVALAPRLAKSYRRRDPLQVAEPDPDPPPPDGPRQLVMFADPEPPDPAPEAPPEPPPRGTGIPQASEVTDPSQGTGIPQPEVRAYLEQGTGIPQPEVRAYLDEAGAIEERPRGIENSGEIENFFEKGGKDKKREASGQGAGIEDIETATAKILAAWNAMQGLQA